MPDFASRLAAAQAGDEAAFVELFRSVQPALLRYLMTLGGGLAEDVASDTWVTVVRGLDAFRGDEKGWRSWVFTIAHSRLRDAQRKHTRTPMPVDAEDLLRDRAGTVDVGAEVEEMFSTEAALELIGLLPKVQAEVVLLRHVAGLDVAEVAEVVRKRPGTVRVTAHRALRKLADLLAERESERDLERETDRSRPGCNDRGANIGN